MNENTYNLVLWAGVVLWLLETAYFGWNMTAQSGAERVLDIIVTAMIFYGAVGGVAYRAAMHALAQSHE